LWGEFNFKSAPHKIIVGHDVCSGSVRKSKTFCNLSGSCVALEEIEEV